MSRQISGDIRRVCVVRTGGMGDILLATPALRALNTHCQPDAIDYIVGRGMAEAVTGIGYLRKIITFDKNGADARPLNFLRFLLGLRRTKYDLFLNFHPGAKTYLMAFASGAKSVITFTKDRRVQSNTGKVRHAIDDFSKELKPLGIETVSDRQMDFHIPDSATETVSGKLASQNIAAKDRLLVINPAATRTVNRLPSEKFADVINRLIIQMPYLRIALTGAPNETDLAADIIRMVKTKIVDFAGQLSIKELGALLKRADVFLTADTGPLHIASAVGGRIVCLSGAADPNRTGPVNSKDLVVINRNLDCVPCQASTCRRGDIACMTEMPVDWVVEAVVRRLESIPV